MTSYYDEATHRTVLLWWLMRVLSERREQLPPSSDGASYSYEKSPLVRFSIQFWQLQLRACHMILHGVTAYTCHCACVRTYGSYNNNMLLRRRRESIIVIFSVPSSPVFSSLRIEPVSRIVQKPVERRFFSRPAPVCRGKKRWPHTRRNPVSISRARTVMTKARIFTQTYIIFYTPPRTVLITKMSTFRDVWCCVISFFFSAPFRLLESKNDCVNFTFLNSRVKVAFFFFVNTLLFVLNFALVHVVNFNFNFFRDFTRDYQVPSLLLFWSWAKQFINPVTIVYFCLSTAFSHKHLYVYFEY